VELPAEDGCQFGFGDEATGGDGRGDRARRAATGARVARAGARENRGQQRAKDQRRKAGLHLSSCSTGDAAYHAAVTPGRADLSSLHVLVPVRGLSDGKTRLGETLDAEERETLIVGLVQRLLNICTAWPAARRIHVVSDDPVIRRVAEQHGASVVNEPAEANLNAALIAARDAAVARHATAVLILPADLPLVSVAALDRLLDAADAALAAGNGRALVVAAPSDARGGTNALLLSPPDVIEPQFGLASLEAHVRAARHADASVQLVVDPQLGFDLDTPDDLERIDAAILLDLTRASAESAPA